MVALLAPSRVVWAAPASAVVSFDSSKKPQPRRAAPTVRFFYGVLGVYYTPAGDIAQKFGTPPGGVTPAWDQPPGGDAGDGPASILIASATRPPRVLDLSRLAAPSSTPIGPPVGALPAAQSWPGPTAGAGLDQHERGAALRAGGRVGRGIDGHALVIGHRCRCHFPARPGRGRPARAPAVWCPCRCPPARPGAPR